MEAITSGTEHWRDSWEHQSKVCSDGKKNAKQTCVKHVRFSNVKHMILIPDRKEQIQNGLVRSLYYDRYLLAEIRTAAYEEIQVYMSANKTTAKEAMKKLCQVEQLTIETHDHCERSDSGVILSLQPVPQKKQLKVLIVNDSPIFSTILSTMLRKMCCEVTSVQSGSGAVWILEEGIELFDLLVIDLSITDIDGVDLIEMIRKKMNLCTPILILTATECSNPVAQRALSSGGESCELMEKPFDHSTFASIISRLLCITL